MTISVPTSGFREAKWIVSATPGFGTHTTIAGANAASSPGDTILIRDGTYTENPTALAGRTYTSWTGSGENANCTVIGKWTMTEAGTSVISNIRLQTNGDFLAVVSGANVCGFNIEGCYLNCTNNVGISFTNSNAASDVVVSDSFSNVANGTSTFASSAAGTIAFDNFREGNSASTTPSTASSGVVQLIDCEFGTPIDISGTAIVNAQSLFSTCINTTALAITGTGSSTVKTSSVNAGTAAAITIGAGATLTLLTSDIASSAANAITGAGTILYDALVFTSTAKTITVTTQNCLSSGSFTPALSFGGASVGITYAEQIGRFYRSGNICNFIIEITLTSKGSSTGIAAISGLPFVDATATGSNVDFATTILALTTTPANTTYFFSDLAFGQTSMGIYAGAAATGGFTQLDETHFANNTVVRIQGIYFI